MTRKRPMRRLIAYFLRPELCWPVAKKPHKRRHRMRYLGAAANGRQHWRGTGFSTEPGGLTLMEGTSLSYLGAGIAMTESGVYPAKAIS